MATYKDQNGKSIVLGNKLGQGGEASVYLLAGDPQSVVKIFLPEKRAYYEPRLTEMIAHPPDDQTRNLTPPHISITWAERMVFERKKFVGYVMPVIKKAPDIFKVYSPKLRSKELPGFDWKLLHHVACNLAIAVNAYHAAGYVIGDLNSKNVKVHANAMVTMVDTDSIQVTTASGQVLRCPVGVPEYTSPELQGVDFKTVDRDKYHDAFSLSVMIFQLLMEGYHPFTGVPVRPSKSVTDPANLYCIQKGIFPFSSNTAFAPSKFAPDYNILHPEVRALFDRCFVHASASTRTNRPSPLEWYKALTEAENELKQCKNAHWYYSRNSQCPWCKRQGVIAALPKPVQRPVQQPIQQPARVPQARPAMPPPSPIKPPSPVYQPAPLGGRKFTRSTFFQSIRQHLKTWIFIGSAVIIAGFFLVFNHVLFPGNGNVIDLNPIKTLIPVSFGQGPQNQNTPTENTDPAKGTPLPDCVHAPKLIMRIGDMVLVNANQGLRGHREPNLSSDNIVARHSYGDTLMIVDGPVCVRSDDKTDYWFWQVKDGDGITSWVAEGDHVYYYLRK